MEIKYYEINYKNFGNCLKINNDFIELIVSLDFGPRILSYKLLNFDNIFYEDIDRELTFSFDNFSKFNLNKNEKWTLYGGHRLWIAPESSPHTYYPDNIKISYEVKDNIFSFIEPIENYLNIQKIIEIEIIDSKVNLNHKIYNYNAFEIKLTPWTISAMKGGGMSLVPLPKKNTTPLENTLIKFWPYNDFNDERFKFVNDFAILEQNHKINSAFKYSINNESGQAFYFIDNFVFLKQCNPSKDNLITNYESYTNKDFLEMEFIGKTEYIPSDSYILFKETWNLFTIKNFLKQNFVDIKKFKEALKFGFEHML
ncbi:hypothetical protein EV215_0758 [Hypnocyclicus thermotrophus]|uniref:Uncharacterized protein n=1 Tax=Hypnocyclicus thermotrophus TaxID=1627895 RepID=A0AA46I5W4_9FUSO|nr:hypothetical protein [Hypnocyclicus thermotrophus]TDT71385.1 hypothetical protein EV215_0758 [Hypnocyclicus thermotrophus]